VSPNLIIWLSLLTLSGVLAVVLKDRAQRIARRAFVAVLSAFVLFSFGATLSRPGRMVKTTATLEADRADLLLRIGLAVQVLDLEMHKLVGAEPGSSSGVTALRQQDFHEEAIKIFKSALVDAPDAEDLKAKLAVAIADAGRPKDKLEFGLICRELAASKVESMRRLGQALPAIYLSKRVAPGKIDELSQALMAGLPEGWYRDTSLLRLYKVAGDSKRYDQLFAQVEDSAARFLLNVVVAMLAGIVITLTGAVVLIIQVFLLPRRLSSESDDQFWRQHMAWDGRIVYVVFVAWLATEILFGSFAQMAIKNFNLLHKGPLIAALSTALSYVVATVPGLVYMYWCAFRPHGIKFRDGLNLKLHVGKRGPVGLCLTGIWAWTAAVPTVIVGFMLANRFLGSQGSSNPIISLLLDAARSSNPLAGILLYLTVGLLAPFCEEALFRGFLYGSLRSRLGVGTSLFVSAALFSSVHLDPGAVVPLFCIGWICGFVFERTRSLVPSMVAHGLWNCASFSLILLISGK